MFVVVARVLIELVLAGLIGAVVLSYSTKPGSALIVPSSLAAFRKRAGRDLRRHLTEDLAIWEKILSSVRNSTGYTYLYTREMERVAAALTTTIHANQQLIALHDALEPLTSK